ncbi:beta-glucosidase BglX [Sphingobacterium sp. DR205]|uniref:beta-glucosidase BglX n=1 Tax=Sphingobacterium sp. DR205 TaxID=2713573 RepID=UPI0013E49DE4|nr:beta-glucosidase BglX [Sphingobacterium sp. DR205]QIH35963.1 beta-glucosidase BglX [Sphingobacterium sp. DR205]
MKKKIHYKLILVLLMGCLSRPVIAQTVSDNKAMDSFITKLMKGMTPEEKLGQLNLVTPLVKTGPFATKNANEKIKDGSAGNVYAVMGSPAGVQKRLSMSDSTRLKIPLLSGLDIIHGYRTIFPIPLGLSCSWDTVLTEKTARVAAVEASAMGYNWAFSPMVDITRDPRWGRVMEGSGEDAYLGSLIARAMVRGYQGKDLRDPTSLMACVKHFALYGAAEAGRNYNTTDMSKITMYQNYLPPYKAAIDAGAGSIMSSFNDIDGVPATANRWLLTDLLRKLWHFNGFVVTDFNAINELINHGVALDNQDAAALALRAGVDMDMASESMISSLSNSVKQGRITMEQIDMACRRVLEAKYKLGLFNGAERRIDADRVSRVTLTEENKKVAREAAVKSMVLLENKGNILPLRKNTKIALIGPFADSQQEMLSMWSFTGDVKSVVSIYEGIKKVNPLVVYAEGTQVNDDSLANRKRGTSYDPKLQEKLVGEAMAVANRSDVIVAVLGESSAMSGEARSRTDIGIPSCQGELLKMLKSTGKPVILLLTNGRPLTLQDNLPYADAVLEIWRPGSEAGNAVAAVLFGDYNPSGKLTMTFPRSVGQIPIYYNYKNTGRPYEEGGTEDFVSNYKDQHNTPLYPFGYGLSYTDVEYGPVRLKDSVLTGADKTEKVSIKLTNTGKFGVEETVQLYLGDPLASVTRPVKELKQFRKVKLLAGETKTVDFTLTAEDLKFFNSELEWDWEPGKFVVYVGPNSRDVKEAGFVWNR